MYSIYRVECPRGQAGNLPDGHGSATTLQNHLYEADTGKPTAPSDTVYSIEHCTVGWSVEIFLIEQNRSTNQRAGMILEVQIQNFGERAPVRTHQSFHFKKFQGA